MVAFAVVVCLAVVVVAFVVVAFAVVVVGFAVVVEHSKIEGYTYDKDKITDYALVWSAEFDYEGLPDDDKWGYDVGGRNAFRMG